MMKYFLFCLSLGLSITVAAEPAAKLTTNSTTKLTTKSTTKSITTFTSPLQQTTLLELYTSEGCSSCPPADRWLSTLKTNPRLWKEIIPIAFHVDYWNYLGWKDKYSRSEYSQRQRNYARFHNLKTIYTPGVLRNGQEFRSWRRAGALKTGTADKVGRLVVSISNNIINARFSPEKPITGNMQLNVAWLGFDLVNNIKNGENEGKKLQHDFVSYATQSNLGNKVEDSYHWKVKVSPLVNTLPNKKGAAFWITNGQDPTPIQATGGWM